MGLGDRVNGVNVDVDGKELISASSPRPRVDVELINSDKQYEGLSVYDVETSLKTEIGYDPGRLAIDTYTNMIDGDKIHIYHLEVPEGIRGYGLGTILFNVYKEFAIQGGFDRASLRVGGGEDTKEFLIDNGVNPDYLHVHNFPGTRATSVVLTTESNFRKIQDMHSVKEVSEEIRGVFTSEAFIQN